MGKFSYIFPGQGSQKVGMGAELVQNYPIAREIFDEADAFIGKALSQLCFEGPETELKQTENTQLAILTCSVATLQILKHHINVLPKAVAGHSLGEYTALVASGVLTFADAFKLVSARAKYMAEVSVNQNGTMAAILGMDMKRLQQICDKVDGIVRIANYNCPGQLVISGEVDAVHQAVALASEEIGSRRCRLLPVSGAFHSPLMESAAEKFKPILDTVTFHPPETHIVMNVTGDVISDTDSIKHLLYQQITAPVQWEKTLNTMWNSGVTDYVEIGPGNVLSGLVKRTLADSSNIMNVEDSHSLSHVIDELGNGA